MVFAVLKFWQKNILQSKFCKKKRNSEKGVWQKKKDNSISVISRQLCVSDYNLWKEEFLFYFLIHIFSLGKSIWLLYIINVY